MITYSIDARGKQLGTRTREVGIAAIGQDSFAVTHDATVTKTYTGVRTIAFTPVDGDVRMAIDPDSDVSLDLIEGKWQMIFANTTWPIGVFEDGNSVTIKFRANSEADACAVCVYIYR